MTFKSLLIASALTAFIALPAAAKGVPQLREIPLIQTEEPAKIDLDVQYLTGGIGDDERAEMESVRGEYNFHALNSKITGEFVEDTQTTIQRKNGKALETVLEVNAGPMLYAVLTPGTYVVEATRNGELKKQQFTITSKTKARDINFRWKTPVVAVN